MRTPASWLVLVLAITLSGSRPAEAQMCPTGTAPCGATHCTPDGGVCCASSGHEELSCAAGESCTADGGCSAASSGCRGGGQLTLASCGGDTCGCSAPCTISDDCMSGCCTTAGLCAPSCVCTGGARLFVQCDTGSTGATGLTPSSGVKHGGCDFGDGAPFGLLALSLVATALWLGRRASML